MASTDRRSGRDLIAELGREAPRFRFFQAVRLLALARNASTAPAAIRFGSPLALGFPASEIADECVMEEGAEVPEGTRPGVLRMAVAFMGMTGPSGALPVAYTESLIERRNACRDTAAHAFLDMFTHRSVSLFHQAWRKYRFHIPYEAGERDGFTRNTLDLVGAGLNALQPQPDGSHGIPPMLFSYFAGLLSQKPVSAASLSAVLRACFRVPVTVEQFIGQWMLVPHGERTRLGRGNCALGETGMAGERMWDRQNKMTVRVGPLDGQQFAGFLPGCPGAHALRSLLEFFVGQTLACDVSLVLDKACVPRPVLGTREPGHIQLGYNAWLYQGAAGTDQETVRFTLLN